MGRGAATWSALFIYTPVHVKLKKSECSNTSVRLKSLKMESFCALWCFRETSRFSWGEKLELTKTLRSTFGDKQRIFWTETLMFDAFVCFPIKRWWRDEAEFWFLLPTWRRRQLTSDLAEGIHLWFVSLNRSSSVPVSLNATVSWCFTFIIMFSSFLFSAVLVHLLLSFLHL